MRVVLAVQRSDLGLALQLYLDAEPGLFVVGTATEASSLRALLRTADPDLAILDWNLPGYAPVQLLAEAKKLRRCTQLIVLGRDESVRQEALAAGADAFVLSGDSPADLMAAIRESRERHRDCTGMATGLLSGTLQAAASGQVLGGTTE
ncbi:response regulator transcription factor [Chloroflexota bacterium]